METQRGCVCGANLKLIIGYNYIDSEAANFHSQFLMLCQMIGVISGILNKSVVYAQ